MKQFIYLRIIPVVIILSITNVVLGQLPAKTRTLTLQKEFDKTGTVRIYNTGRPVEIKLWNQSSIKLELTIPDSLAAGLNENSLIEKLGIKLSKFSNRADITLTGGSGKPGLSNVIPPVVSDAVAPNQNRVVAELIQSDPYNKSITDQRILTLNNTPVIIYLPETGSLDLVNKNSTVSITGDIQNGYINLENSTLDASDASSLRLIAKFSNISFDNIDDLEADISSSSLRARNVAKLDIESTRSTVEYETGISAFIRSNLDNSYTIEKLDIAAGRLLYSNLRIEQLNKQLDLDGNNYDLKIRQINPEAELVKINNSWANLRLPLNGLTNYSVTFDGKNCAVFASFEIIPEVKEEIQKNDNNSLCADCGDIFLKGSQRPNAPRYFRAKGGNVSGKHTRFEIVCQQCTVDFK